LQRRNNPYRVAVFFLTPFAQYRTLSHMLSNVILCDMVGSFVV
jgi:hypothetical protein